MSETPVAFTCFTFHTGKVTGQRLEPTGVWRGTETEKRTFALFNRTDGGSGGGEQWVTLTFACACAAHCYSHMVHAWLK